MHFVLEPLLQLSLRVQRVNMFGINGKDSSQFIPDTNARTIYPHSAEAWELITSFTNKRIMKGKEMFTEIIFTVVLNIPHECIPLCSPHKMDFMHLKHCKKLPEKEKETRTVFMIWSGPFLEEEIALLQ